MKNNKGITMIALIITIIILLILAGVSIAMLSGKNGILTKASTSAEATKQANAKERLKVELMAIQTDCLSNGKTATLDDLDSNKDQLTNKNITITDSGSPRNVTLDGYTFKVKDDLTIEGDGTTNNSGGNNSDGDNSGENPTFDNDLSEFISNTNYSPTLEDIFSSSTAVNKILQSNNNIDYIISNYSKYSTYILNNPETMKLFASNRSAMDKMIENDNWRNAILASNTAIAALDASNPIKVPTMTSNTAPSGEAFASSAYPGYYAWKAFVDTGWTNYWSVAARSIL